LIDSQSSSDGSLNDCSSTSSMGSTRLGLDFFNLAHVKYSWVTFLLKENKMQCGWMNVCLNAKIMQYDKFSKLKYAMFILKDSQCMVYKDNN